MRVPFNQLFLTGNETKNIEMCLKSNHISGDGQFTKKCQAFVEQRYNFLKTLLTTSCTDALEMAGLLLDIQPGDEIIMPSFTFVSTANAFILRGGVPVFCDSLGSSPNLDVTALESLITSKTKAVCVVHYGGVAVDMDPLLELAKKHGFAVIEDAAQAIECFYKGRPLGGLGVLGAYSFHETKNIMAGEGGLLILNDESLIHRAEIMREKGTNRAAFFRGEVDKYNWVAAGSSFLPTDIVAAFLFAQLQSLDQIHTQRKKVWERYEKNLQALVRCERFAVHEIPDFAEHNGHIFHLVTRSGAERSRFISFLREKGVQATFHYQPLHMSPFWKTRYRGQPLPNAEKYGECLVRLPLYAALGSEQVDMVCELIHDFYRETLAPRPRLRDWQATDELTI